MTTQMQQALQAIEDAMLNGKLLKFTIEFAMYEGDTVCDIQVDELDRNGKPSPVFGDVGFPSFGGALEKAGLGIMEWLHASK